MRLLCTTLNNEFSSRAGKNEYECNVFMLIVNARITVSGFGFGDQRK